MYKVHWLFIINEILHRHLLFPSLLNICWVANYIYLTYGFVTNELYVWDCGQFGSILVKCLTSYVLIPNSQTMNVERRLRRVAIILKPNGKKSLIIRGTLTIRIQRILKRGLRNNDKFLKWNRKSLIIRGNSSSILAKSKCFSKSDFFLFASRNGEKCSIGNRVHLTMNSHPIRRTVAFWTGRKLLNFWRLMSTIVVVPHR